jgi:cysteine desulfurase/selenocysteine lyase
MVQRKSDEFTVFFTLNTTSAIQQVMHQLAPEKFQRIFVSEIEHNSVFLPSITVAKRNGWERKVLPRFQDGGLDMDGVEMDKAVLLVNSFSNIDGRQCVNLPLVAKDIREREQQ